MTDFFGNFMTWFWNFINQLVGFGNSIASFFNQQVTIGALTFQVWQGVLVGLGGILGVLIIMRLVKLIPFF